MDKIRELLEKMGADPELAQQIITEMEAWKGSQQDTLMEQYKARLDKAKAVCIEETEKYKHELSRKVEIFLESQVNAVERDSRERLAIEESESVNTLKQVKAMLEGVKIDGTTEDLQAVQVQNEKLRKQLVSVTEDMDSVKVKYEHVHGIAQKVLKRNQVLESKVSGKTEPITESKGTKLETARKGRAKPKTTRPTLIESQIPGKQSRGKQIDGGNSEITAIAEAVSEIA